MQVEFHPQAEQELLEAVGWYEERVPGLAGALQEQLQSATDLLIAYPELGAVLEDDFRRLALRRFPYYLIYRLSAQAVYVVAFAHDRRRPGYWRDRI